MPKNNDTIHKYLSQVLSSFLIKLLLRSNSIFSNYFTKMKNNHRHLKTCFPYPMLSILKMSDLVAEHWIEKIKQEKQTYL